MEEKDKMRTIFIAAISIVLAFGSATAQPGIHNKKEGSTGIAKEDRAMKRQENRMEADYRREERRNRKEVKKMYKQSNKANKRPYDTNENGNVFGL